MEYAIFHEEAATMEETVEFVPEETLGAIAVPEYAAEKIRRAIERERELMETLRTGLPRKVRG